VWSANGNHGFLIAKLPPAYTGRHTKFEAETATDVVIDRKTVNQTCINGPQWFMRDFADKVEEAENTGVAASSEKAPPGVRRDKALRDEVHRDEAHRDKVGEDKIRRDKDKRKRKQAGAPRSRRGSPSGAEHHAELFAADRGGGSRSRTRIELGSGQGLARTGEMLSGGHLHAVRVRCKARDAFI